MPHSVYEHRVDAPCATCGEARTYCVNEAQGLRWCCACGCLHADRGALEVFPSANAIGSSMATELLRTEHAELEAALRTALTLVPADVASCAIDAWRILRAIEARRAALKASP